MTMRHFVTPAGGYLGGFAGGALPDAEDAIEVAAPPQHALEIWSEGQWVWPLAIAQVEKLRHLQARYAAALAEGMNYGGSQLQIREVDQQNITAMGQEARWALASGGVWPTNFAWRMLDNSFLPVPDPQAMIALGEAAKAEVYRLRQVKWAHADAIAAAGSIAALNAHDIENGW
jgi:hypothetical protein